MSLTAHHRGAPAPLFLSVSTSSSESSVEGKSDSEEEETKLQPNCNRTVISRSAGGTQSELGHRTSLVRCSVPQGPMVVMASIREVPPGQHYLSPQEY
jgi:hypothetical protein